MKLHPPHFRKFKNRGRKVPIPMWASLRRETHGKVRDKLLVIKEFNTPANMFHNAETMAHIDSKHIRTSVKTS